MLTVLPAPAASFAPLIEGLCQAVAAGGARGRLAGPLVILVWVRLRRLAGRFARLAARLQSGALPAPGHSRRGRPAATRSPPDPAKRLPQGFGWLVRLAPEAAAGASQLRHLLAEPEMAALIAAAPQMGRLLRPLCRMLGVDPPPGLGAPHGTAPPQPPARPAHPAAPVGPPPALPRRAPRWRRQIAGLGACGPPLPT
jgi:hypothetical protein